MSCEMVMGYRTSERLPLIHKSPNSDGVYFQLYKRALADIGCTLKVVRDQKKRIMKLLKQGKIDFYPGLGYSPQREQYIHYIENGLRGQSTIVTHNKMPKISDFSDLAGKVLIRAHGSKKRDWQRYEIIDKPVLDLSVPMALELIVQQKADLFIYNIDSINYYLTGPLQSSLKVHDCCFPSQAMFLGFSKNSQYAGQKNNPNYITGQPAGVYNLQYLLDETSKAFQFQQALKKLMQEGYAQQLINDLAK